MFQRQLAHLFQLAQPLLIIKSRFVSRITRNEVKFLESMNIYSLLVVWQLLQ